MATQKKFFADLGLETSQNLSVDGNATISGDLTVNGTSTTINTTTTSVEDNMLELANGNISSDLIDIGFYGNYDDGLSDSGATEYTGLFRDATDSTWKLFDGLEVEPGNTVDTSGTGYALADLTVGDLTATTLTATNGLTGSSITYPTSDGTNGQVITTNGSGTLSFSTVAGTTINNNADNRVITGSGTANTLEGEANLTFDGSSLVVAKTGINQASTVRIQGTDGNGNGHPLDLKMDGATDSFSVLIGQGGGATPDTTLFSGNRNGNVGIGVTSPADYDNNAAGISSNLVVKDSGHSGIIVISGTSSDAAISFGDGTGTDAYRGAVAYVNSQDALYFKSGGSNRMIIDGSGNLLIGTTSDTLSGTDSGFVFKADGNASFVTGSGIMYMRRTTSDSVHIKFRSTTNASVGQISSDGSNTTYSTSSDYRLKENVIYDWDATTRLKQLKPARFNFLQGNTETQDGFLAHEVQSIVPIAVEGIKDAVDENGDIDPQSIDHSKLVPLLVKTIQELEERITALESA